MIEKTKILKKPPKLPEFFNNFWSYAENNHLSANAKVLYMVLLNYTNKNHWSGNENIKLSNRKAMEQCSFTNTTTLVRARQELIDHHLIFFAEGKKDQTPSQYKLRMKAKYKGYKADYDMPPVQAKQSNEEMEQLQEITTNRMQPVIAEETTELAAAYQNDEQVTEQVTKLLTECDQSVHYISSSKEEKKIKLNSDDENLTTEEMLLKYADTSTNEMVEIPSMETLNEGDICFTTKEKQCYLKVLRKTKTRSGLLAMQIEYSWGGTTWFAEQDIHKPVFIEVSKSA